ncbi:chaperone modulator CbpM [Rhizobium sp. Root483D2]|uniref:chaperone modulator CbpM n=1 Tax=Rhizobium sp. Root483D2 TaxID=1736545 RepID=UPI000713E768|nr:chaperone modulator CbpM [Rhizobium sp. Root483D2]KQY20976.1 transcriptional regulator [Rhizobium sp. Root483D2]
MDHLEFCERLSIVSSTLTIWIDRQWIIPELTGPELTGQELTGQNEAFHDADLARGLLILDLSQSMGVNQDGIDVIMALVDQVHGLRSKLHALTDAVREQDGDVARSVVRKLEGMR